MFGARGVRLSVSLRGNVQGFAGVSHRVLNVEENTTFYQKSILILPPMFIQKFYRAA